MHSTPTHKHRHLRINAPPESQSTIDSQELEITSLRQQLKNLKDLYQNAVKQKDSNESTEPQDNIYLKQRIEKLMGAIAEREKQMRDLQQQMKAMAETHHEAFQNERKEKLTALNEIDALQTQLKSLKEKYLQSQRLQKEQVESIESLLAEKEQTTAKLQEAAHTAEHRDYLESECERLSQTQIDLTLQLENATNKIESLENALRSKEEMLEAKELLISTHQSSIDEAEKKIATLQNERNLLQENLFNTQNAKEDAEARLKMSHFHLAKKVKESTQLTDRNEELETLQRESQSDLHLAQEKIQELQKMLEDQFHHEKKRYDQLQDSFKNSEARSAAWEKKYFEIMDKWREYEQRFHEMKKIEDRLQKIHSQWINMGFLFDGLQHVPASDVLPPGEEQQQSPENPLPENVVCDTTKGRQSLFDIPQQPGLRR